MYSTTSLGPSVVGLVKPDILKPGTSIISAAPPCNINRRTRSKNDTSMATPAAAEETSLMAQYFSYGFYPSGKRTVNLSNRSNYDKIIVKRTDYIEPSMTLLKAILTNSAGTISSL